jgi:hypothetical protein
MHVFFVGGGGGGGKQINAFLKANKYIKNACTETCLFFWCMFDLGTYSPSLSVV